MERIRCRRFFNLILCFGMSYDTMYKHHMHYACGMVRTMKGILRKKGMAVLIALLCFAISGCGKEEQELKDGYYTAEMAEYDFGWKEFVSVCISNGQLVSIEYNAKNPSGYIKSWDMNYMRNMESVSGTYPNEYTRKYAAEFLETQSGAEVDMITGATSSGKKFAQLADAAMEQARKGDSSVVIVEIEE